MTSVEYLTHLVETHNFPSAETSQLVCIQFFLGKIKTGCICRLSHKYTCLSSEVCTNSVTDPESNKAASSQQPLPFPLHEQSLFEALKMNKLVAYYVFNIDRQGMIVFLVGAFCEPKNARPLVTLFLKTTDLTLKGPLFLEFL